MLFNYRCLSLLLILRWLAGEQHQRRIAADDGITSVASLLGARVELHWDSLEERIGSRESTQLDWYKGMTDGKRLSSERYRLHGRIHLLLERTSVGDEGFYTLKLRNQSMIYDQHLFHVTLFKRNLSLWITPSPRAAFAVEQQINVTCSISFFADRTRMNRSLSQFESEWQMIIYNKDPDQYRLDVSSTSRSYTYTGYLLNYELDRYDHNQTVSCSLIQPRPPTRTVINVTGMHRLNIEFPAYMREDDYFTRSFNSHSSIEIDCEAFSANPPPVYTLIRTLNGDNQTLLHRTKHGRYSIHNATWRHRGNYTCLAENHLNGQQAAHQTFRLNVWYNDPSNPTKAIVIQRAPASHSRGKWIRLVVFLLTFLLACLVFVRSLARFIARWHRRAK